MKRKRLVKVENMESRMLKMKDMEERMAKMENSMEKRIEEEVVKRVNAIKRQLDEEACLKANKIEGKMKRLEASVKCFTRAKRAKEDITAEIKKELVTARLQDWDYDPAEQRYCICNQVAFKDDNLFSLFPNPFPTFVENVSATRWL